MAAELGEVLLDQRNFRQPALDIDTKQFVQVSPFNVEACGVEIGEVGNSPNRGLFRVHLAVAALENPSQHPAVLAITGPQVSAVLILAKPVDVADLRQLGGVGMLADLEPVREV